MSNGKDEISKAVAKRRRSLEKQITTERGSVTAHDEALLDIYCELERERLEAVAQVCMDGMMTQSMGARGMKAKTENKAAAQVRQTSTAAARLLAEIFKQKPAKALGGDADDDVDDLDEY